MEFEKILFFFIAGLLAAKYAQENDILPIDREDQTGSILDDIPESIEDMTNKLTDNFTQFDQAQADINLSAFLWAIRKAEGTAASDGYRALFGYTPSNGKTFSSYADHPRILYPYTNLAGVTIKTSAAGAYQITKTTFDALANKYGFSDFYPSTQDAMATTLIKERGALDDVRAGRFDIALSKVRKVWASLPNSNVNQPTRSYNYLASAYTSAGGKIA